MGRTSVFSIRQSLARSTSSGSVVMNSRKVNYPNGQLQSVTHVRRDPQQLPCLGRGHHSRTATAARCRRIFNVEGDIRKLPL